MIHTIRILLTIVLIYFIYFETGTATAIYASLVSIALESIGYWIRCMNKALRSINNG